MFENLTGLGYGIIVFAILIGVGTVILFNFGGSVAVCDALTPWNATAGGCYNSTDASTATPSGAGYTNTAYLTTQLGSTGLAGWTPAIIAISVGLLFLGAFMIKGGSARSRGRY